MRGLARVVGPALAVALAPALMACSTEAPDDEVHTGRGRDEQLAADLAYFDVELPRRTDDLAWSDGSNWDTTTLDLAFRTDRRGVRAVLDRLGLTRRDLAPVDDPPSRPVRVGDIAWPVASWRGAREHHGWAPGTAGPDMISTSAVTLVPEGHGTTAVLLFLQNGV